VRVTFPSVEQNLTMGPLYNKCIYSMTLAEGSWEDGMGEGQREREQRRESAEWLTHWRLWRGSGARHRQQCGTRRMACARDLR